MKTPQTLLFFFLLTCLATQAQTILRVNNIPTVDAPYRTIAAAISAAGPTDIIMVEGSPTLYDATTISITKKVTIIGTGYFIDGSIQANPYNSRMGGGLDFNAGSEGSTVTGLEFSLTVSIRVSNLTFSNNRCTQVFFYNVSDVTIKENYVSNNIVRNGGTTTVANILISNNYVGQISIPDNLTYSVITNNIIWSSGSNMNNAQVNNNIFLVATANPISSSTNATLLNNVFVAPSQTGAGASNIFNATVASLFVGLTGNTTDTQWKLKVGSLAIGAGAGGVDCGMYGGVNPYKPYGIRSGQPTLTGFTAPGTVPVNGTLNVKVSAKVN
jgi:hypothetical protein